MFQFSIEILTTFMQKKSKNMIRIIIEQNDKIIIRCEKNWKNMKK